MPSCLSLAPKMLSCGSFGPTSASGHQLLYGLYLWPSSTLIVMPRSYRCDFFSIHQLVQVLALLALAHWLFYLWTPKPRPTCTGLALSPSPFLPLEVHTLTLSTIACPFPLLASL